MSVKQSCLRSFKVSLVGGDGAFFVIRRAIDAGTAEIAAKASYPLSNVTKVEVLESDYLTNPNLETVSDEGF